jgi:hypothetical protein
MAAEAQTLGARAGYYHPYFVVPSVRQFGTKKQLSADQSKWELLVKAIAGLMKPANCGVEMNWHSWKWTLARLLRLEKPIRSSRKR